MAKNRNATPFDLDADMKEALGELASINAPGRVSVRPAPAAAGETPAPAKRRGRPKAAAAEAPARTKKRAPAKKRRAPAGAKPETERPAIPAPEPSDGLLMTWYDAMKPRSMGRFVWLVLLRWQAARTGGVIVVGDFARLVSQKPEKVCLALADLKKSGWISIDESKTVRGARRKVVSKTIAFAEKAKA